MQLAVEVVCAKKKGEKIIISFYV
jgi:hypothetical protein